jgi:chromosome segregation ATPase
MKNAELHVRRIDEGAMDERSGMNFSEYIAILSGDTTLLEKSKLDRKVAALESMRTVHFKEVTKTRYKLEGMRQEIEKVTKVLSQLKRDEEQYRSGLTLENDGTKSNPIHLSGMESTDSETIGKHVIDLYRHWKPHRDSTEEKIGSLYGFELFIRQQEESLEENGLFERRCFNSFYVRSAGGEIKYTYSQGHPAVDNPRLAARHFLQALDRVGKLKEQQEKKHTELRSAIIVLENLAAKPFEKEQELISLKAELQKLEREMTQKIQHKNSIDGDEKNLQQEAVLSGRERSLLPKIALTEVRQGRRL